MMVLLGACTALPATQPVQSVDYYAQLLGPKPSDTLDFANAPQTPEDRATLGAARGYFTHYGTDHHVFVLYNKKVMKFRVDALDSDAYCLQLYDYREQAGWNGNAWPRGQPRAVQGDWPDVIEPLSDIYPALVVQGPLG